MEYFPRIRHSKGQNRSAHLPQITINSFIMKTSLVFPFFIWSLFSSALANMASPTIPGTLASSPFNSQHIDILHEKILIIPDENFSTASFHIEYHIESNKAGQQIPLLFYAAEYREEFEVSIDGQAIELLSIPEKYRLLEGTPFSDFDLFFAEEDWQHVPISSIHETESSSFHVYLNDLKYFELDLDTGKHVIQVQYTADRWISRNQWMNRYDFRYALSPAKYWKSFGGLEVTLDASRCTYGIHSNLGLPVSGDLSCTATWRFDHLPVDILRISFEPEMPRTARILTDISLDNLGIILGMLFMLFHLMGMYSYRKANPHNRFSWVMIVGSLLIPFLALCAYVFSFEFVRMLIGEHASNYHFSYVGMYFVMYPFIMPVYFLLMWAGDMIFARRFRQ